MTIAIKPRHRCGALALCAVALVTATPVLAGTAECTAGECMFELPAMPLRDALREINRAAGLNFSLNFQVDVEVQTQPLDMRGSTTAVLEALLEPLGLSFRREDERTVEIFGVDEHSEQADGTEQPAMQIRPASDAQSTEEVLVTAGRIRDRVVVRTMEPKLDFARAAPVKLFERKQIAAAGASTVSEFFKQVTQSVRLDTARARPSGAQYFELRGLGAGTVLVLINGRRIASSATDPALGFDASTIPAAHVDRIELLMPSTHSGMDGVGGIVNIVLRRDIPQPEVEVAYGAARGGGRDRRISFGIGHRSGRVNGALFATYQDRDPLLGHERERSRNQDYRRFGGRDVRTATSSPGNVTSLAGHNLPGLPTSFASIPTHVTSGSAGISDFQLTAGQRDLTSLLSFSSLTPATERFTLSASVEAELSERWQASADVIYSARETTAWFSPPILSHVPVSAANPHNPFGETVIIDRLLTELPPRLQVHDTTLARGIVGIGGEAHGWNFDLGLLASKDEGSVRFENDLDLGRALTALNTSDPDRALNVFGAGPIADAAMLAEIRADASRGRYESAVAQLELSAHGPLLELPAGTARGTFGMHLRTEDVDVHEPTRSLDARRRTSALFAELEIPLVKGQQRYSPALQLVAGARVDDYGDEIGRPINPALQLIWRPADAWTVRASRLRTFQPPSLMDLHDPPSLSALTVYDPELNNQLTPVTVVTGGNVNLRAVAARTSSISATFEPPQYPSLSSAVSYWHTQADNLIQGISPEALLANEEHYPGRVVRETLPEDVAAGLPGRLMLINVSPVNFGSADLRGIDMRASYAWQTPAGRLEAQLNATWIGSFRVMDHPNARPTQRVGVASPEGTIPRWLAVASLEWERGVVTLSGKARYTSPYDDADGWGGRSGRTMPAQILVDAQASVDLREIAGDHPLARGFRITVGATNLFDRPPAYSEVVPRGYDPSQEDLLGRFVYLRITKGF